MTRIFDEEVVEASLEVVARRRSEAAGIEGAQVSSPESRGPQEE
jgi:hypothetical protein